MKNRDATITKANNKVWVLFEVCIIRAASCTGKLFSHASPLSGFTLSPFCTQQSSVHYVEFVYNYYVAHSTCVWTTQPCSEAERKAWYEEHGQFMPVLVAEYDGRIVGWGALGSFRAAYTAAGVLEDSVYVHHDFHRRKIGSRLLEALIEAARRMGLRSILANISADQTPSIRLHEKFGFQKVAHLQDVGQKFNQRFDAIYLQLLLAASFSVKRMAAGGARLRLRGPGARRHRSPRR